MSLARAVVPGLVALVLGTVHSPSAQSPRVLAVVDATVVPMDAPRTIEHATVLVRGDRIVQVGPTGDVPVPADAVQLDGRGKFLLPGLAEMHGHIPPPSESPAYVDAVLLLFVANGVTTVRGMLGAPNQLDLRARANRGDLLGPTLYLAGPSFNDSSVDSPATAERMVREQKAQGWDLLKIHPGLTREEYDAVVRTARAVDIEWAGHVPAAVGLLHVLESGQRTIDHLDGYIEYLQGDRGPVPEVRLVEVAELTRKAGVGVVPTMALWETLVGHASLEDLKSYSELRYMPPRMVESWIRAHEKRTTAPTFDRAAARFIAANRKRLLKALHDRGVEILLGTDAPQQFSIPGFSIHREVRLMEEAGLTPYAILRAGTAAVGRYFERRDRFGLVAPGHRADLILLEGNPLRDLGQLSRRAGVIVRGRWIPETEIQARLAALAASFR